MCDISSLLLLSLGTAHREHLTATPQFLSERERRSPSITTVEMEGRLKSWVLIFIHWGQNFWRKWFNSGMQSNKQWLVLDYYVTSLIYKAKKSYLPDAHTSDHCANQSQLPRKDSLLSTPSSWIKLHFFILAVYSLCDLF